MNYINVGYDSTNNYAISLGKKYILIDVGMPGTMKKLMYSLKRNGINLGDISYLIVTHFDPDHCGLAQDLQLIGVELIISQCQKPFLEKSNKHLKSFPGFKEIIVKPENILKENDKKSFLRRFGSPGYFISTPGHSEDSISIVIEGLGVFIGDFPAHIVAEDLENLENKKILEKSWQVIKSTGEKRIFPAHSNSFEIPILI